MSQTLNVDLDLICKFNIAGPRYTSYPPATHFTEEVTREQLMATVRENNQDGDRDLSLYFHLPFCESLCWFCGCTTVITTQHGKSAIYLDYLRKEIEMWKKQIHPDRKVSQIHLGGGTPTFFQPDEIRQLGALIHDNFDVAEDVEAGVEIDPRRLTREKLEALREVGFNRTSIGVQDINPVVQKAVHRIQPIEMTTEVVGWIRDLGFESLNIDLIYGLPHQTVDSFKETLDAVLKLEPERFAIFSYAHVPWMKPAQKILTDAMPSPEVKLDLLKLTTEQLTTEGYVYIGMDHFSLANDELAIAQHHKTLQRNFQGYSTKSGTDIYSFGMSSISQAGDAYWQNQKELPPYYEAVDAGELPIQRGYILTDDDKVRRETIMRLMCDLGLDYAPMSEALGFDFAEYFADELASLDELESDGLIVRRGDGFTVTDLGRLLIRVIAMHFDAYSKTEREGRYSKAI